MVSIPVAAPTGSVTTLAESAAAKQRRLRLFLVVLAASAAAMTASAKMHWYDVAYESDTFNGVAIEVRPEFTLDAGQMAEVARAQPSQYTVAPTVDQVLNLPTFVVAAVVGALVGLVGLYFRSAAMTLLGAGPLLYAWIKLSQTRFWFEAAPGRDNWSIDRASGQTVFWLAMMLAAFAIAAGAFQASAAYRADRRARVAAGEAVEDTAFDLLVKVVARGANQPTPVKTADRQGALR